MAEDYRFISKKYRGLHFVWLQKSNTYLMLKEPAFDILTFIAEGKPNNLICDHLKNQYHFLPQVASQLIEGFQNELALLNQTVAGRNDMDMKPYESHNFTAYSQRFYRAGNRIIEFSFETPLFESYLHPLIAHLEVGPTDNVSHKFELFGLNRRIVLRRDFSEFISGKNQNVVISKGKPVLASTVKNVLGTFQDDETHLLKGKIFIQLASALYEVPEDEWLMAVHASALTNGKKTILFTASPGGGKSTLAAILQKNGYRLISDDFVPFNQKGLACYFPAAMSVKEGALKTLLPYYPSLNSKPENIITPEKRVRYLAEELNAAGFDERFPVSEVIFVGYNPKVSLRLRKLQRAKGISQFLNQVYIKPEKLFAQHFMNWALKTKFYQLTYSDNESAIKAISNLFDND